VLVDTSVWSAALRQHASESEPEAVVRLRSLVDRGDVVLSGLVLQEVLQGFKQDAQFKRARLVLAAFPLLQLDRTHYVAAAALRRTCAARGVAASTVDCQIAASAIGHRCALLTTDADFVRIAEHSPLKLVTRKGALLG
jgi:predicted nucleic acid-binding protein